MSSHEADNQRSEAAPGHLHLPFDEDVRAGVVKAVASILGYGLDSATRVRADRVRAVHEYRKSARRARAILALCRDLLDPAEFDGLWSALRDGTKPTSELRDSDVFPGVLDAIPISDRLAKTAQAVRAELSQETTSLEGVEQVLQRGTELLSPVPERFEAALPAELDWAALEKGLRRSYRAVRKSLDQVRATGKATDFHTWRKRTKELGYQLELLTTGLGGPAEELRRSVSAFATELGGITDRLNLARRLAKDAKGKRGRRLARAVRKDAKRTMAEAIKRGRKLTKRKPKRFSRDAMKAIASARMAEVLSPPAAT